MIGAGIGALFGLVFDPLLLALVVGGAEARWLPRSPSTNCARGCGMVGEALDSGTAVVLALTYPNGRSDVENTLYRANSVTACGWIAPP